MCLVRPSGLLGALGAILLSACTSEAPTGSEIPETSPCGPSEAVVQRVHDGDTFTLQTGQKVRLLMIDTPEVGKEAECFGDQAAKVAQDRLTGKTVKLRYDPLSCTDRFGRLLAYVTLEGREINTEWVERGLACVLYVKPSGAERLEEFQSLETRARSEAQGLWAACSKEPC